LGRLGIPQRPLKHGEKPPVLRHPDARGPTGVRPDRRRPRPPLLRVICHTAPGGCQSIPASRRVAVSSSRVRSAARACSDVGPGPARAPRSAGRIFTTGVVQVCRNARAPGDGAVLVRRAAGDAGCPVRVHRRDSAGRRPTPGHVGPSAFKPCIRGASRHSEWTAPMWSSRHAVAQHSMLTCGDAFARRFVAGHADLTDTWHQWQAAYPTLRKDGYVAAPRFLERLGSHSHQSTGFSGVAAGRGWWRRPGGWSRAVLLASHDGPGGADSVFRSCPALTRRAGRDAVHAPATEPAAGVGTVPRREHLDPVRGRLPGRPNSTTPSWPPPRSTRQLVAPRATKRRSGTGAG
jgi:hypothetical protein